MISRFAPIKGQHIFMEAIERISTVQSSAEFVIAGAALFGEEEYEAGIRRRATEGPIRNRVTFPGFLDDVSLLLSSLDILVHPSTHPEGFGQVVVEAMMCGKPVIVSASGGSAELVEDGVTGRLVPPGDAVSLASAINDLLAHPAEAMAMGRRAREVALRRYDIVNTARAIQDVYEKVLAKGSPV